MTEQTLSDFMIQQSTAAIVILNTDFTIVDANDAYLKTVKKTKNEVVGANCYEISHGVKVPCSSAYPGVKCPMVETLRSGKDVHIIHDHPGPDGNPMFCNMATYPIKNDEGEIVQIIEFWKDITEDFSCSWDKQAKELKSNVQKLVQEDRMISMGKLAASCAHEINNPIQGLITFSHLMLETLEERDLTHEDQDNFKTYLTLMATELERCGSIVSGLLSFSRQSELEYKDVDLNDIIHSVLSLIRHRLALENIELSTLLYSSPLIIKGDANQLQQCFLNMIFNAIEAMPKAGKLTIVSKMLSDTKTVQIEVRDTGHGISPEDMENLFEPFFTTKKTGKGTGLGLSIAYGVVKNHKGDIKIESMAKEGTAFIVTFPAR